MEPDRPNWIGFVCWVLIVSGMYAVYTTMKAMGSADFAAILGMYPYSATLAEGVQFGTLILLIICGICMYERQGWARYLYLLTMVVFLAHHYFALTISHRMEAMHDYKPPHDWAQILLTVQVIAFVLSIPILFTRRARRYYHPPLYVDE